LFELHTEWISKGFILSHRLMQNETDDKIAVDIVKELQAVFPSFKACSFDKGFHSPSNQQALKDLLKQVTLPKKSKLAKADP
jgi:IS5 family transposase